MHPACTVRLSLLHSLIFLPSICNVSSFPGCCPTIYQAPPPIMQRTHLFLHLVLPSCPRMCAIFLHTNAFATFCSQHMPPVSKRWQVHWKHFANDLYKSFHPILPIAFVSVMIPHRLSQLCLLPHTRMVFLQVLPVDCFG
jgi:hypothetical protein